MTVKLDHREWTAAQHPAPCVICHQPAILRSPRGKPPTGRVPWRGSTSTRTKTLATISAQRDQEAAAQTPVSPPGPRMPEASAAAHRLASRTVV